jgi:hypothetical protein
MPAVLAENGFIDNPSDAAKLSNPGFQNLRKSILRTLMHIKALKKMKKILICDLLTEERLKKFIIKL